MKIVFDIFLIILGVAYFLICLREHTHKKRDLNLDIAKIRGTPPPPPEIGAPEEHFSRMSIDVPNIKTMFVQ